MKQIRDWAEVKQLLEEKKDGVTYNDKDVEDNDELWYSDRFLQEEADKNIRRIVFSNLHRLDHAKNRAECFRNQSSLSVILILQLIWYSEVVE